jgi:hypothetical protein
VGLASIAGWTSSDGIGTAALTPVRRLIAARMAAGA